MAWSVINDLWHMLFQYSIERTDVLTNGNPFIKVQCNARAIIA